MAKRPPKPGDKVSRTTSQGETNGSVERKLTRRAKFALGVVPVLVVVWTANQRNVGLSERHITQIQRG